MDYEQRLIEAAMRYQTQLAQPDPILHVPTFVATCDADLQAELSSFIELVLVTDQPEEPIILTDEEQAFVDRMAVRARERLAARIATRI